MIPEVVLRKLLGDFKTKYAEASQSIGSMIGDGSHEDAEREAHSIKGVAGSLGLSQIQNASESLESAIRANDEAAITAALAGLTETLDGIIPVISAYISETD